ncbi:MAG: hypothetical protein ABW223_11050 [Rariglobus sp.]
MLFQFILFVALVVGTLFYSANLGLKKVLIYWAVFIGTAFLVVLLPGLLVIFIQLITVGVFYVHAKAASAV